VTRAARAGLLSMALAAIWCGAAGAASAGGGAPLSASQQCARMRAASGPLRLAPHRRTLRVLATGDSMIYPADQELALLHPRGMTVIDSRHDGTGLTTNTVNWRLLAESQAATLRPDATVITVGGRDGGISLPDAHHHLVPCCAAQWLALYAGRLRPLIRAYVRGGRARVYWLLLPAPQEALRAPLFAAVNDALRLLAPEFAGRLRLLATDEVISPGGFQQMITYDGLQIHPRAPDGIHLTHPGACVERSLIVEAMLADGLLVH
jgi:hypothetical protein